MGLNDRMDASAITEQEIADCENFSIENGSLVTSAGYVQWDDAPQSHYGPYWGGFMFKKADGTMVDVRQRRDTLEYSSNGGTTWLPCTMPTTGSPATTLKLTQCQPTFAALNDICVFTNGFENVLSSTNGITWTIQAGLPKSKVVFENAKNRLVYLAQTGVNRQFRFDWSGINDPLTIGASSYQLVDPNNNGPIMGAGLTPDGTTLLFKEAGAYTISDFVDNGIIDINFIGLTRCTNHHTICTTDHSVMWHSYAGVSEYMGGQIRTVFGKINLNGRNDVYRYDLICAAFYNNKYRISMPDADISTDYNSQEYLIHTNVLRQDATQPYAITRNRRYIGCYFIEDNVFAYGRDVTLYFGDSRPVTTSGSPAQYVNTIFAFINDYRSDNYVGGLNGSPQTCFFATKYFTENMAYYSKKYKKMFADIKLFNTTNFVFSYRFLPYGAWVDTSITTTANDIDFDEGFGFSGGYGFSQDTLGTEFLDINNPEKPRGIQFKISVSTIQDITILNMAYSLLVKPKFK